jgi:DNA/RNA-binding domain of Phe-tRNA-synthetase-like protein
MALNITLAGGIVDSNDVAVNANLQIFVYNSKNGLTKWSDVFLTEDTDYNKNLGDPDISSQENTLGLADANGEFAVIAVWLDGSRTDINAVPTEFAFIVHELNGSEVYVQDIKLNKPNPIDCSNWEVPEQIIQGENIIALNHNTNEMTYEAKNITHYLYKKSISANNEIIFPFMGTCNAEYNFNNEGYTQSNVYIPQTGGDTSIDIKVQDCFGTEVICSKITKVFYKVIPCFNHSPEHITKGTTIQIVSCASGHTDKITEIKYDISSEILLGEDVSKVITELGVIPVTQFITYYNAYENIKVELHKDIQMENIPPELALTVIAEPQNDIDKKEYTFAHLGTDEDGYIAEVKWEIFRNNPDINGNENYSLYYSTGNITDLSDWTYDISDIVGDLKIRATVYDNMGASAFQDFEIANDCSDIGLHFDNIDWNKSIKTIVFSQKVSKQLWETKVKKIQWDMKSKMVQWDSKPKKRVFNKSVISRQFKYKIYFNV